jgi:hypothetical protein
MYPKRGRATANDWATPLQNPAVIAPCSKRMKGNLVQNNRLKMGGHIENPFL